MKKKYLTVLCVVMMSVSFLFAGCEKKEEEQEAGDTRVAVEVMKTETGSLVLTNHFVGTVMPQESVYIIPMAQGTVTDTYFEVGDPVNAGEILFEIDDTPAKMQLEQAKLTYENTKAQVNSTWTSTKDQLDSTLKQLEAQKLGTLAQLEGAQTQYFSLLDSVNQGTEALEEMKKQHGKIDTMTTDEVLDLAKSMGESMLSASGGMGGSMGSSSGLGGILGGILGGTGTDSGSNGGSGNEMTEEEKAEMAEELRPELKKMLADQIKETERSMNQAQMSLNTAYTSMKAAEESYYLVEDSIKQTAGTDLSETKAQLDNSVNLAKLGVESAELALSYYDVTSPISGTVITKGVEVNGFATSSQPAYVIANFDTMTVTFFVSESIKNTLQNGAGIKVERNGAVFDGVITEVANAVNRETGLFQIKGTVYADGDTLPSGVSVKLAVETYRTDDAILIPYDAVYYESTGAYVYVMKDGIAVKTAVKTGLFDEATVEIAEGLSKGDTVITSWSPRLIDGAGVKTVAE